MDKALAELRNDDLGQAATVHQVRKRCKKIRALLRLVRGSLSNPEMYASENACFRDAARSLSALRDAEALLEAYDKLIEGCVDSADRPQFGSLRRELAHQGEPLGQQIQDPAESLRLFHEMMTDARGRAACWHLGGDGFTAIVRGLGRTYRRGRRARTEAYRDPTGDNFHDWRKRVKYHWYHCRLLRDIWKPVMSARIGELDKLATLLGDYHDLVVLRRRVEDLASEVDDVELAQRVLDVIERRQEEIRLGAHPCGRKLFAEKPKHLRRRFEAYWNA
jgi:CHAD domain-containing protein